MRVKRACTCLVVRRLLVPSSPELLFYNVRSLVVYIVINVNHVKADDRMFCCECYEGTNGHVSRNSLTTVSYLQRHRSVILPDIAVLPLTLIPRPALPLDVSGIVNKYCFFIVLGALTGIRGWPLYSDGCRARAGGFSERGGSGGGGGDVDSDDRRGWSFLTGDVGTDFLAVGTPGTSIALCSTLGVVADDTFPSLPEAYGKKGKQKQNTA